ncbi:MAG: hypothetical protein L0I76_00975 [Pseudonocardia sp.]|nr:hypothetical protein [Pseudonocardia sp.]
MSAELRRALRDLAAGIVGRPASGPRGDGAARGGGPVPPGACGRGSLLAGAALLTGRGDLAQDAVHVALARVRLTGDGPVDRVAVCTEVLREARSRAARG